MSFVKHIPKRHVDEGDNRVLGKLEYEEPKPITTEGQICACLPIRTTLDSLSLGGLHTISSGGRQFWIQNKEYAVDYWPVLGGVPSPDGPGRGGLPTVPYARIYSDTVTEFLQNAGDVHPTASVPYEANLIYPANFSAEGVSIIPAEDYEGCLCYEAYYTNGSIHKRSILTDTRRFRRDYNVDAGEEPPIVTDQEYTWWYKTPLDNKVGESLHFHILKEDKTYLKVRPRLVEPTVPWRRGWARTFSEPPISVGMEWVDSDREVYESAHFIVDSVSGSYTFTASPTATNFSIMDGGVNFNTNNSYVIVDGITHTLNRRGRKYIFLKTPTGWKSYYHIFQEV